MNKPILKKIIVQQLKKYPNNRTTSFKYRGERYWLKQTESSSIIKSLLMKDSSTNLNKEKLVLQKFIKLKIVIKKYKLLNINLSLSKEDLETLFKKLKTPLHSYNLVYSKKFNKSNMKNTNKINNGLVRLPLYPGLKKKEILRIIKEVKNFNLIKN